MKTLKANRYFGRQESGIRVMPVWLVTLFALLLVFGGSAQFGKLADIPVRTAAAAVIIFLLASGQSRSIGLTRLERAICLLVVAIPALQLVPLPPALWTKLGGRALYAAADQLIDPAAIPWRPISLDPDRGLDSLLFLLPVCASFLIGKSLGRTNRELALVTLAVGGIISAILGTAQISGGEQSKLRFYANTNFVGPLGFFANRNHFALFMSLQIAVAAYLVGKVAEPRWRVRAWLLWGGTSLLALFLIVATQSRAGIVIGAGVAGVSPWLFFQPKGRERKWLALGVFGLIVSAMILALHGGALASRFQQLESDNARVEILPQLGLAARDNLPMGSGVGSFEHVFPRYEKPSELVPTYWNHAHNDFLQLIIETGLPGVVALCLFGYWWLCLLRSAIARTIDQSRRDLLKLVLLGNGIMLLHSLLDYPFRTALLSGIFAFLCGVGSRITTKRGATRGQDFRVRESRGNSPSR